jgi:hypothetical protein
VRDIGECRITLPQGQGHTPVILGEPGDAALLGAVTLEILGLVLNPFTRELQPSRAMLAVAAPGRDWGQGRRRSVAAMAQPVTWSNPGVPGEHPPLPGRMPWIAASGR